MGKQHEVTIYEPEVLISYCCCIILDFPIFRTLKKKFQLFLRPPSLYLLSPKRTKAGIPQERKFPSSITIVLPLPSFFATPSAWVMSFSGNLKAVCCVLFVTTFSPFPNLYSGFNYLLVLVVVVSNKEVDVIPSFLELTHTYIKFFFSFILDLTLIMKESYLY